MAGIWDFFLSGFCKYKIVHVFSQTCYKQIEALACSCVVGNVSSSVYIIEEHRTISRRIPSDWPRRKNGGSWLHKCTNRSHRSKTQDLDCNRALLTCILTKMITALAPSTSLNGWISRKSIILFLYMLLTSSLETWKIFVSLMPIVNKLYRNFVTACFDWNV